MIIAIPHGKAINPLCAAANAIAIVAPLDCINIVNISQTTKNMKWWTSIYWLRSIICDNDIMLSLRYPSHKNMTPSQIHILEIFFRLLDLPKSASPSHQIHTITKDRLIISYFNQIVHSRTSVSGAQTLAPIMTHTALCNQITPAHTKARIIRETTPLLCNIAVTNAQVNIDLILF
jgi:hypothetical protein